jgi:hypothetical protein
VSQNQTMTIAAIRGLFESRAWPRLNINVRSRTLLPFSDRDASVLPLIARRLRDSLVISWQSSLNLIHYLIMRSDWGSG